MIPLIRYEVQCCGGRYWIEMWDSARDEWRFHTAAMSLKAIAAVVRELREQGENVDDFGLLADPKPARGAAAGRES